MVASLNMLQGTSGGSPNTLMMWLPFILIFVIMYFLILRPQARKQKDLQKMLASLKKGDRVVTAGGLYGEIVGIKEQEQSVLLKIAENVKVEVARASIGRKLE